MRNLDRIVQLKCKKGEEWISGSGYLLENKMILTVEHVVPNVDPTNPVQARFFKYPDWYAASVVWSSKNLDIALLKLEASFPSMEGHPKFGQVSGTVVPVEAIGFPDFGVLHDNRDTELLLGQLRPFSRVREELLEIDVIGQSISEEGWKGMSGAALFCKGYLIGVVKEAIRDTNLLIAQPIWKLENEEAFWSALQSRIPIESIIGMSGTQPALIPKVNRNASEQSFAYSARATEFLGRDDEMSQLNTFLRDNRPFLWWIITGKAGSGKSRLALELTRSSWGEWWTGFLSVEQDAGFWSNWRPEWPTLMVCDYVEAQAAKIGNIVNILQERSIELEYPVRILLVSRTVDEYDYWYNEFLGKGSRTIRENILSARYKQPLHLPDLSLQDSWSITEERLHRMGSFYSEIEKQYLIGILKQPDFLGLPLYAMLLADAFAHESQGSWDTRSIHWDPALLIENILEREQSNWREAGATRKDINVIAHATILGGLKLEFLEDQRTQNLFPIPEDYNPDLYRAILGKSSNSEISPLTPSLIGEIFVLTLPRSIIDSTLKNLIYLALELDAEATCFFILRTCLDFPTHENVKQLLPENLISKLFSDPVTNYQNNTKSIASALAFIYAYFGRLNDASMVCDILLDQLNVYPDDQQLQYHSSHTLYNVIVFHAIKGYHEMAKKRLDTLIKLWEEKKVAVFGEDLANAFFSLGTFALEAGDYLSADKIAESLEKLTNELSSQAVKVACASLFSNIILESCKKNMLDLAKSACTKLMDIQVQEPYVSDHSQRKARCLRNICKAYANNGNLGEALKFHKNLLQIVGHEPDLLKWKIQSLSDLLQAEIDNNAIEEAWKYFVEIKSCKDFNNLDDETLLGTILNLGNYTLALCKVDCFKAEQVYFTWHSGKSLKIRHCRNIWTQTGANLVLAFCLNHDFSGARRIYTDICGLFADDPKNEEIGIYVGKATQALLVYMSENDLIEEAKIVFDNHRNSLNELTEDSRKRLFNLSLFYLLYGLTNPNGNIQHAKEIISIYKPVLTSNEFMQCIRNEVEPEVTNDWVCRMDNLSEPRVKAEQV